MDELKKKIEDTLWATKSLFDRGLVSGSSANVSFIDDGKIYISGSGTCFGRLNEESFSVTDMDGKVLNGVKPSKELPLHRDLYLAKPDIKAIIHTHGTYAVLWSMAVKNENDIIPAHTPYLKMKLGTVGLIPYAKPGSDQLFSAFKARVNDNDGYILKQHGAVVGGKSVMDAFYSLEELEESAKIAWLFAESKN